MLVGATAINIQNFLTYCWVDRVPGLLSTSWIAVFILFMFISQSLVLSQALNDPASQANIRASHISSKFVSEINTNSYYINYDTKNKYCLINSTYQGHTQTTPNKNTSIAANNSGTISRSTNVTALSTDRKVEATPSVINKTVPTVINIYNSTVIMSDKGNETIPPATDATVSRNDNDPGGNSLGPQDSPSKDGSAKSTGTREAGAVQEGPFSAGRSRWGQ